MDTLDFQEAIDEWESTIGPRLQTMLDAARNGDIRRFNIRRGILYNTIDDLQEALSSFYYHQADMMSPNKLDALRGISKSKVRKRDELKKSPFKRRKTDPAVNE